MISVDPGSGGQPAMPAPPIMPMPKVKRLIVTADDFGLSLPVNEAVEKGHRQGILSAASLMVGAPAAKDAVARARGLRSLGVGLHLTLLDGRPSLPPEKIPGLVGRDGRFSSDPFRFGVALFHSPELRRQANAEISTQFERFGETGLVMDHINSHQHFHLHPVVLRAIIQLAPRYGSPPVRLPLEPFGTSLKANGDRPMGRMTNWLFYLGQTRRLRRGLFAAGMQSNDHVFGLYDSGAMVEDRLLRLIRHLPFGISEVYCHPASGRWEGPDNFPFCYRCEEELHALLSPNIKAELDAAGLSPLSFRAAVDRNS
jgi:chitin disaccharide deacetylase